VLELGEDEGGSGYLGGAVGVGDDVLEGGPALGDQDKPAFSRERNNPTALDPDSH
jgi:hypothetical protein